jgi:Dullard-like phosphatase family protein
MAILTVSLLRVGCRRLALGQVRTKASVAATKPVKNLLVGQRATASLATPVQPQHQYQSDLVVVLDMDECLLHSHFFTPQAAKLAHQVAPSTKEWNSTSNPNADEDEDDATVDTFYLTLPDGDVVLVHQRPHLLQFLEHVTSRYETHIFTAAVSVYAKPVLDRLDPFQQLAGRWYRESCLFQNNAYVKDLNILQKPNLDRVVLVDNNPLSFMANPENGILVQSFYKDASDNTLLAVLDLLQELEHEPDVKPVLERKFGLKAALKEVKGGF